MNPPYDLDHTEDFLVSFSNLLVTNSKSARDNRCMMQDREEEPLTFSAGRLALADRDERIIFWAGEYRSEPFLRKGAA